LAYATWAIFQGFQRTATSHPVTSFQERNNRDGKAVSL